MDKINMYYEYRKRYSGNVFLELMAYNKEEAERIRDGWQREADNGNVSEDCTDPMAYMLGGVRSVDDACKDMHASICKAYEELYFGSMSREACIGAAAVLSLDPYNSVIQLFDTPWLRYHCSSFVANWNDRHPDQKPVSLPAMDIM